MTTRRRRTTSSSSSSRPDTGSTTTRRPDSTGGGPGGDGVNVSTDGIDTMAGRLGNTGGRVDAVGTTLDGINVGPQSMGIIGSGFTGAAQSHVSTARQHVTRTRSAVQNAQDGTTATADTYRTTDTNNATNLGGIDTETDVPTARGGDTTTTPSSTTGDTGGTSDPPSTNDTGGTNNGNNNGGNNNGSNTGNNNGGDDDGPNNPPPNNPPGDDDPPPPNDGPPSDDPPTNRPTNDELAPQYPRESFDTATTSTDDQVRQIAQDRGYDPDQHLALTQTPTAQLDHDQRVEVAEVRNAIPVQPGEIMTKVIKPEIAESMLRNDSSSGHDPSALGGSVARGQDTAQYDTPAQYREKLGLDDRGEGWSPVQAGASEAYQLRFPAPDSTTALDPSFGSTNQRDADDMQAIAGNQEARNWKPPFLGTGYTDGGSSGSGAPEWMLDRQAYGDRIEMWTVREDGTEGLVGVNLPGRGWFDVRGRS